MLTLKWTFSRINVYFSVNFIVIEKVVTLILELLKTPHSDTSRTLHEELFEELGFLRAVYQGLEEARDGNTLSLEDAKKSLGI